MVLLRDSAAERQIKLTSTQRSKLLLLSTAVTGIFLFSSVLKRLLYKCIIQAVLLKYGQYIL